VRDDELPRSLAGFDLTDGLRRLQGNRKLYRKLLLSFATNYLATAREIRKALDAHNMDQAHSLVHTLKGVAGNLAAKELQMAAVGLEKLVKLKDKESPPSAEALNEKLTALESSLNRAIEAVQTLTPAEVDAAAAPSAHGLAPELGEPAREAAQRLRDAAEMGDVAEVMLIAETLQSRSKAFTPYSERIVQMADEFDFDGIVQMAGELEKSAE
jgi:HPt (histidine-containing phosphotransfer) domain-containing protein